jgi:hypothetical protein
MTFHKRGYIYKSISPLTKVLGLHTIKSLLHRKQKLKITKGGQVYATSASRSAAEEGVAKDASAFGGGTDSFIAGVKETGVEKAAEAAEGEIIATMAGANLFAFSKKAFSSEWERPWEEPTFS